mmetsp:Transcript_23707/g.34938  ORF Transcript_23707/g.34938 Transcript_23707/m.34938 type:complete len:304 (-) Transcript_23707:1139-2050(-)
MAHSSSSDSSSEGSSSSSSDSSSTIRRKKTARRERTRDEVLEGLLTNKELSDVSLRCNDGAIIHANRCLLVRSPVFDRMLTGNFLESKSEIVDIVGFNGTVLRAVVEYIYTDSCALWNDVKTKPDALNAKNLMILAAAAEYFDLPNLKNQTRQVALGILRSHPSMATIFLEECQSHKFSELERFAWKVIRSNLPSAWTSDAAHSLGVALIEEIIQDDKTSASELQLFQLIQSWAGNDSGRKNTAKQLIKKHIRLENIDPSDITSTVKSSDLVTVKQVSAAFEAQALKAEAEHGVKYKRLRYHR